MNIARMLRRTVRQVMPRKSEPRNAGGLKLSADDIEDQVRVMPDKEFADYLRRHSKSHWWKA